MVRIMISADSNEDIGRAMDEVTDAFLSGSSGCVSGGCTAGWSFEIVEDQQMTKEKYFQAVKDRREARRQNDPGEPSGVKPPETKD
jgi:hypothetical protein